MTNDLRREHPTADDEELEFLAFTDASTSTTGAGPALVVAAADVDADVVTDLLAPAAAVSAVRVGDGGTSPTGRVVPRRRPWARSRRGAGYSWYDATELEVVIDLLG